MKDVDGADDLGISTIIIDKPQKMQMEWTIKLTKIVGTQTIIIRDGNSNTVSNRLKFICFVLIIDQTILSNL